MTSEITFNDHLLTRLEYPWTPALFIMGALAVTVSVWIERPLRSSIGLGLILVGMVFYR